MQRLPLPALGQGRVDFERSRLHQLQLMRSADPVEQPAQIPAVVEQLTLNLELPPLRRASHWLAHLQTQQLIFDPEPARVLLLRALDLPAWWIDSEAEVNGWLQQPQAVDSHQWAARLGLTPPTEGELQVLGSAGAGFERGLIQEMTTPVHAGTNASSPAIAYWPGWPELVIEDPAAGLLRAGWLQTAAQRAARLVSASAVHCPDEWDLLQATSPCLAHPSDAPPEELRARHSGQPLMALAEDRPTPPLQTLREWQIPDLDQRPPQAAVVVSLHNYADRIANALQSVKAQTQQRLEMIVVDDASTDDGSVVVENWIDSCLSAGAHPFVRLLLLRHGNNAGLAAARNTAFAHSQAPWCFVLDADNALFPNAVAGCLALADTSDPQLAVVHPLLTVEAEPGRPDDRRTLVSSASWQQERLSQENVVDAMALIRRSAWEQVGGYTHIEGGWEDYDFWCKLAEAGYHGLQCPRILAAYRSHAESMSHRTTNRSWYALSRTLQKRHPWLKLPLARGDRLMTLRLGVLRFVRGLSADRSERRRLGAAVVKLLRQRRRSLSALGPLMRFAPAGGKTKLLLWKALAHSRVVESLPWSSPEAPAVLATAIRSTQAYTDAAVALSRDRNGFLQRGSDYDQLRRRWREQPPQRLLVFHHFDNRGLLPQSWRDALLELQAAEWQVVVSSPQLDPAICAELSPKGVQIVGRTNIGLCLGAYRDLTLLLHSTPAAYRQLKALVLCNDSNLLIQPPGALVEQLERWVTRWTIPRPMPLTSIRYQHSTPSPIHLKDSRITSSRS